MSYTRSYSSSITVSGSRTVRYPASQSGGSITVNFSETEPVYIDVYVNTNPFDSSVFYTQETVDGLTGSVVAMNSAQCAAIRENAQKISGHLTDGFFNMINSDLSMKRSENFSQLQAKMALLLELNKDVQSTHNRMEEDMGRLRSHYQSIFQGLDEDLEKRIEELDRPAFQLGEKVKKTIIIDPALTAGAATADEMGKTSLMSSLISVARLKKQISSAISGISRHVTKSLSCKSKIEHILNDEEEAKTEYIPIIYSHSNETQTSDFRYASPGIKGVNQVINGVSEYVKSAPFEKWQGINSEDYKFIDQEFINLVEEQSKTEEAKNDYSNRVYAAILRLWNDNKMKMTQLHMERQEQRENGRITGN